MSKPSKKKGGGSLGERMLNKGDFDQTQKGAGLGGGGSTFKQEGGKKMKNPVKIGEYSRNKKGLITGSGGPNEGEGDFDSVRRNKKNEAKT